ATLLPNGKVLIAGGSTTSGAILDTAELFDPSSGTFTVLAPMTSPRFRHTATLLPSGEVLIAGGWIPGFQTTNTAEVFDSASGTFTALPNSMTLPRGAQTATLLPSGTILLAGGYITVALPNGTTDTNITNTAEV